MQHPCPWLRVDLLHMVHVLPAVGSRAAAHQPQPMSLIVLGLNRRPPPSTREAQRLVSAGWLPHPHIDPEAPAQHAGQGERNVTKLIQPAWPVVPEESCVVATRPSFGGGQALLPAASSPVHLPHLRMLFHNGLRVDEETF